MAFYENNFCIISLENMDKNIGINANIELDTE